MTAINYEAERQSRQLREQREAALLRLKVRGVGRLLGGRFLDEDAERSSHTIELAPTIHLWARRDWQKKNMIRWGARCPSAQNCSDPSISTGMNRSVADIAADLQRRLIPEARASCKSAMESTFSAREMPSTLGMLKSRSWSKCLVHCGRRRIKRTTPKASPFAVRI